MNPPDQPTATPRTDSEEWTAGHGTDDRTVVWSDHARTLERELAAASQAYECAMAIHGTVMEERDRLATELTRLRAELASKTACYDIACSVVQHLRAEVERLTAKIGNQADRLHYLEGATNHATGTPLSQAIARAERAEAALAFIAENGGTTHETECGTISCNGSWCAEQARAAIKP
jgi:hypothetical protein